MSNDSIKKTIIVAVGVCFVCSILVSTAAVSLKKIQDKNRKQEKMKNILQAGDLFNPDTDMEVLFQEKISQSIIDLSTGKPITDNQGEELLKAESFDIKRVAQAPGLSKRIPGDKDSARIKRMPKYMIVYYVKEENSYNKIILPVYGKGLWSTMYGFLALDRDLKTIKGFTFYEHGETPGLGGEVDNPNWKAKWKGKLAFNDQGEIIIEVIKGIVDTSRPEAIHQIDGLSGSTLTTRGIHDLVRFWLGELGYAQFIQNLREGNIENE